MARFTKSARSTRSANTASTGHSGYTPPYGATTATQVTKAALGETAVANSKEVTAAQTKMANELAKQTPAGKITPAGTKALGNLVKEAQRGSSTGFVNAFVDALKQMFPGLTTKMSSDLKSTMKGALNYTLKSARTSYGINIGAAISAGKNYLIGSIKSVVKRNVLTAGMDAIYTALENTGIMKKGKRGYNYYQTKKKK